MKAAAVLLSLITLATIILPIQSVDVGESTLRGQKGVGERVLTTVEETSEGDDDPQDVGGINGSENDDEGDDSSSTDDYDPEINEDDDGAVYIQPASCFSESSIVKVLHRGNVPMKDLRIGDCVLTGNKVDPYQQVYALAHVESERWLDYYQIHSTADDKPLQVSGSHLVYVRNKAGPIRADSIRVGDDLLSSSSDNNNNKSFVTVTEIERIHAKGLYAPLTIDGTIVVDGIVASSYTDISAKSNEFMEVGGVILPITQAFGIHLSLSPLRLVCGSTVGASFSFCEGHDENGMNHYVQNGMDFVLWIEQQNVLLQFACFVVYILVACTLYYVIEPLLFGSMQNIPLFVGIMGALWYCYHVTRNIRICLNLKKIKQV